MVFFTYSHSLVHRLSQRPTLYLLSGRCCYITVNFEMTTSQDGFSSYKHSLHKKNNIIDDKKFDFHRVHLLSKRSCETRSLFTYLSS